MQGGIIPDQPELGRFLCAFMAAVPGRSRDRHRCLLVSLWKLAGIWSSIISLSTHELSLYLLVWSFICVE